jgi:hypothetical protein
MDLETCTLCVSGPVEGQCYINIHGSIFCVLECIYIYIYIYILKPYNLLTVFLCFLTSQ